MVVMGCYGAVLSILLFLFGVNSVLIMVACTALQRNKSWVSALYFCLYNILDFCNKYFQLPLFSRGTDRLTFL